MKKRMFRGLVIVLLMISAGVNLLMAQQSLEERLRAMAEKNASSYITPMVTAFGSGLNSGWFHSAKPHKLLGFDVGIKAMYVTFPEDQQSFLFDVSSMNFTEQLSIAGTNYNINLSGTDLYPEDNRTVPTIFGEEEVGTVPAVSDNGIVGLIEQQLLDQGVDQTVLNQSSVQSNLLSVAQAVPDLVTPGGTGLSFLPLAVPQAAIGLSIPMMPIKAEIVARGFPEMDLAEYGVEGIGKLSFYGGGAKLALDPFIPIPLFPVNIAAGAYYQQMSIGDIFESTNSLLSLQVGKNINLLVVGLGVYGAVGLENTNVKINYTYFNDEDPNDPLNNTQIDFDMDGENEFRTTLGASVRVAIFNLHADYTMGADDVITAGLGISLR